MVMARANLTLEKQKREVEVAEEKLVEAKREVEATIERYKASLDFVAEMAHVVVAFQALKEFFDAYVAFDREAVKNGHELGRLECQNQVIKCYQGLDLSFLDEEASEGEPSDGATTPPAPIEASLAIPVVVFEATPIESVAIKPSTIHEIAPANPTTMVRPFSIAIPWRLRTKPL